MSVLHSSIIFIKLALLIWSPEATTSPVPAPRKFQRSVNQHSIFTVPTGSNYLEDTSKGTASSSGALHDVKTTIAQVQKILEADPSLPRLTRGEIEDLFEEVTKEEYEKSIKAGDISRAKHMRALMLVLPYNTNNTSYNDLQELYNRPPITKLVSSEPKEEKKQKIVIPSGKVEIVNVRGNHNPTTYKPAFRLKPLKTFPDPTTYHPSSTTLQPQPFVTSTASSIPFEPNKSRFSSHYNAQKYESVLAPTTKPASNSKPIDSELENILESLGFSAQSQSRKRFKLDEPPPEELNKRMLSSSIKQDYIPNSFELLPSAPNLDVTDFTKGLSLQLAPRDFGQFKRIPETPADIQPDLESYLTKFGLFPPITERRSHKALYPEISDRIDTGIEDEVEASKSTFKPHSTDEQDFKKLQELLKMLRELQQQNVSISEDALAKLNPRNFNLSETLLTQGPNPLLEPELDVTKNEIKRQTESPEPIKYSLELNLDSSNETVGESTTSSNELQPLIDEIFTLVPQTDTEDSSTTTTSTSTTTTTEETPRNNIAELGESFAGGIGTVEDAEPLPPPRKNGFYFLSDWNSFLEVGEDPGKIVVRFDPKVGDPSRFLPVNVP